MSSIFDSIAGDIVFNTEQLDAAIAEVNVPTNLSQEEQRQVAATVLVGFSYAAALQEAADLEEALSSLEWPQTPQERAFAEAMADALYRDLQQALGSLYATEGVVASRARDLVRRFGEVGA